MVKSPVRSDAYFPEYKPAFSKVKLREIFFTVFFPIDHEAQVLGYSRPSDNSTCLLEKEAAPNLVQSIKKYHQWLDVVSCE